jgi:copper chaperone CopZ
MKTSVIEVHDMLSVLTVDEVEKRIGEVPGVESVTVNHAAGSATVRYDETRLEVADIKAIVHQRGHQSAGEKNNPEEIAYCAVGMCAPAQCARDFSPNVFAGIHYIGFIRLCIPG